jgi:hypothetical protein
MSSANVTLPLIIGAVVVTAAAAVVYFLSGPLKLVTGTVAGFDIAYLGFLLYYFLLPRQIEKGAFVKSYLPGAAARYIVMIGILCIAVFVLKINTLGVLLGTFIGMMLSTFVSLNTIRKSTAKPPEA